MSTKSRKGFHGCIRGFHQSSRAWYSHYRESSYSNRMVLLEGDVDRFQFGMYGTDGGCAGEMAMTFEEVGGKVVPRLKAYDDAWAALASFTDLITRMGEVDDQNMTPDEFRAMLLECGFTDLTKEKQE